MMFLRYITLLCCALSITSCNSKRKIIRIAGSSTVLPIIEKAAAVYAQSHPDIHIQINTGGSGVGVNHIGLSKIDIGMISRNLAPEEITTFSHAQFKTIVIGKDAITPVVSLAIYEQGLHALSLQKIGEIYQGKIKNWQELGLIDQDIVVIDKEASRGTRQVFMQAVLGNKQARADGADVVLGHNNEVKTIIEQNNKAIGMLSFAWLNSKVKALGIEQADGSIITANIETIREGSYPITRSLGLLIDESVELKPEVQGFIDFLLSKQGQQIVSELNYIPAHG